MIQTFDYPIQPYITSPKQKTQMARLTKVETEKRVYAPAALFAPSAAFFFAILSKRKAKTKGRTMKRMIPTTGFTSLARQRIEIIDPTVVPIFPAFPNSCTFSAILEAYFLFRIILDTTKTPHTTNIQTG